MAPSTCGRECSELRHTSASSTRGACSGDSALERSSGKYARTGPSASSVAAAESNIWSSARRRMARICRQRRTTTVSVLYHRGTPDLHRGKIKAALRPAEKVLESLQNGTALESKVTKHIESQAMQTERQIKREFEKLYQFLREEEEARRSALKKEEEKKKGNLEGWIEQEMQSLSDRVMEVEEELGNDDVTFLSNYNQIMTRAQGRLSDSQLNSGSLIDVAKHVGNLRFSVWEKMKDLCPYYPVVLNPNSTRISVSDDLVCASRAVSRVSLQEPVANLALRNTSETYQKEKERQKKERIMATFH
ncbi:nuclear factor 7, brain-like, partial [Clarias magur]